MKELKKGGLIDLRLREIMPRLKDQDLNKIKESIVITDPNLSDNPIVYANQAFYNLTKYDPNETIGKNCRFLQGKDTDPKSVKEIAKAIQEKREITIKIYNYTKSGDGFWNLLFIGPVLDNNLELKYFIGIQTKLKSGK